MSKTLLSQKIPFNPWVYFFIFLTANALLTHGSFGLETQLWIFLIGLVLPWFAALAVSPRLPLGEDFLRRKEFLSPVPLWGWLLLAAACLFIRFYHLIRLSRWPLYDEGFIGYFAMELSQKWDWNLLYGSSQAPPFFIWALSFLFKGAGPSLESLWFLPALFSALAVPLAYLAARPFFSKSISFLFTVLCATSFWAFYPGRFAEMPSMILPAECLLIALLGRSLRASGGENQKKWLVILGLSLGAGFYIHTSWAAFALMAALTLLYSFRRQWRLYPFFILPLVISLVPLLTAAFRQGYGLYLRDLWALGNSTDWPRQIYVSGSYLRGLFWGFQPGEFSPEMSGGGWLNPICGALFFLGLLEVVRHFQLPLSRWLLGGSALLLLPGVMTKTLEPFRILPLFPFFLTIIVLGFSRLSLRPIPSWLLLLGLMIPSAGLDFYHLLVPYQRVWNNAAHWKSSLKSIERFRAEEILKAEAKKNGPGLAFYDFVPGYCDQSLDLSLDSLNAAVNPSISPEKISWAALLINVNYQPFLIQRFPQGKAFWLSSDLSVPDGGMMLWMIPLEPGGSKNFSRWREASLALRPYIRQSLAYVHGAPTRLVLESLLKAESYFEDDPLLRVFFWEKIADTYLRLGSDIPSATQSLKKSLEAGIPSAHLYHHLGTLYWISGNKQKAKEMFQMAVHSPFNQTTASTFLSGGVP